MTRPGETREQRVERIYAQAETTLETVYAKRVRRGPEVLLAVTILLCLGVGLVAAVDLRRLMTPRGTALAWTGAAVFGDCTAYDRLSVAPPGTAPDRRSPQQRCRDLRGSTGEARDGASQIGIDLLSVQQRGDTATASLEIRRPDGTSRVELALVRKGDGWAVVRTAPVCEVVGCA